MIELNFIVKNALIKIDFIKRYEELEDILKEAFGMYEDFKLALIQS